MIYVFVTGVGCEIGCAGTTDNILYIRARVTCRIKSNINENFKTWILNFLDRNNHLTKNDHFFDKEDIYFEAGAINIDGNTFKNIFWNNNTGKRQLSITN